MSTAVTTLSVDEARRLTERIRLIAGTVADNMEKLRDLVNEARDGNAYALLGYASWTAYITDLFGAEPLRLARDVRQELVAELSAQGMSNRAIAPIVGVAEGTVRNDLAGAQNYAPATHEETRPLGDWQRERLQQAEDNREVVKLTGPGSISAPTEARVTGLDGKAYKRPEPRAPKPVITDDEEANLENARQASIALGRALGTLSSFAYQEHRTRMLTDWWPLGKDRVADLMAKHFTPDGLRNIAHYLEVTAEEMEANS